MGWRVRWSGRGWVLAKIALALTLVLGVPCVGRAQVVTTPLTETVYHADGTVASGSVIVSWPSFTAANGAAIPAGTVTETIGSGGTLSLSLVANAGATPIGSYYTAVYHLDDGSVVRQFWVVPVSAAAVPIATIESTVMPLSVAQQTVSKAYVDTAIATAVAGHPLGTSTPYVLKAGDTMTGPLELPGDPTAPLQAAEKQYVDAQVAGLTAGLGQKVSTVPAATQTVAQPTGTTLAVNLLNGVEYASQYATGAGNNGIANATASADCANGCEVQAEPTYAPAEIVAPATWPGGTHVVDSRGGAVQETFFNPANPHADGVNAGRKIAVVSSEPTSSVRAATGSTQIFSVGLQLESDGLTGGSNLFPAAIQATVPYFKTTYSALLATGTYNTPGQHVLMGQQQYCYGVGDCLIGGQFITSSGGFRDDSDEGAHPYDIQIYEDAVVFQATCTTGCTTGSTALQLTATANAGTQGEGRYLIDTNAAKVLTAGTLTGGTTTGAGARQPEAIFTGTSFPVSAFLETAQTIPTQATVMAPGTLTVAMATSGVPAGFQTSTAALPTATGVACVTDAAVSDGRPLNYEMAAYTTIDASHLSLTLNKAHASGATIAVGGLCGFGLEQMVDTSAGIRQVFPVVGSTSTTTLLYAGGTTAVIGLQGNTSAYLNVHATIAAIARSGNVVTVTTAGNLPVDVNGLTLTIAGVADASYNGNAIVTTTGPNTFTYAQTGANGSSSGGTAAVLTGGYALYPMAEVLGVFNAATKAVDGQMTLAANTVPWATGDTVEQPHYFQQRISGDVSYIRQTVPRPTLQQSAGIEYDGNNGAGLRGWQVNNAMAAANYLGNGGTHTAPDLAFEGLGVWQRSMGIEAGEQAAFAVHCNSHGCGKWNSTYNLFELDSNVGVDTVRYAPTTSALTLNLQGASYGFSPSAFTAATVNAATVNATTLNGAVSAASLPVFGPSGGSHAKGAVPDPGAIAGSTRYLREDGTWTTPAGGGGGGASIAGTGFVYEVGGTTARAATANDVAGLTQGANTSWSRYVAFGDSITACCAPTTGANLYANRLGVDVGVTPVNDAVSGAMACDVANGQVFPNENPGDDKNALYTLLISTNEANSKGTGAYEAVFNTCQQAAISWLGSSSYSKVSGGNFTPVPTNWALDTTYAAVTGLKSTTNGASSVWPVPTYGGPVTIWYRIADGNGGTFTYAVDGGTPVSVNGFTSPAISTNNGTTQAVAVAFVPIAAGSHYVTITVTSATGAGNLVSVLAVGSTPAATHFQGPKVYVGGTPYQRLDNLSATTAEYNADVIANVNLLAGYGFGAQFVDVRRYLFGNAQEMAAGTTGLLHPGDLGHQHLEQAFAAAIQPIAVPGPWNLQGETVATTNYTVTLSDRVVYTNCSATCTITLPASTYGQIVFVSYFGGVTPGIFTPGTMAGPAVLLAVGNGVLYHNAGGTWNAIASTFPTSSIQNVPISGATGSFTSLALGDSVVTGNIGGSALAAGACTAATTIAYPTAGANMTVTVSATNGTDPGDGFYEKAWVSSFGNVSVKVCAVAAGTPSAAPYRISVIR